MKSLIQTAALVHYGETDTLMIISILMSVFVIASKSYFFAFSVHFKTFVFNAACVITDITGLFATFIWTYGNCSRHSAFSGTPNFVLPNVAVEFLEIHQIPLSTQAVAKGHISTQ